MFVLNNIYTECYISQDDVTVILDCVCRYAFVNALVMICCHALKLRMLSIHMPKWPKGLLLTSAFVTSVFVTNAFVSR